MDHENRRGSTPLGEKNRMFRSFVGVSVAVLVVAVLMACGANWRRTRCGVGAAG